MNKDAILQKLINGIPVGVDNFALLFGLPEVSKIDGKLVHLLDSILGEDSAYQKFVNYPGDDIPGMVFHSLFRKIGLNFRDIVKMEDADSRNFFMLTDGKLQWPDFENWITAYVSGNLDKMNTYQAYAYLEIIEHYFQSFLYEIEAEWDWLLEAEEMDAFAIQNSIFNFVDFSNIVSKKILSLSELPGYEFPGEINLVDVGAKVAHDFVALFPRETKDFNPSMDNVYRYGIVYVYLAHLRAQEQGLSNLSFSMQQSVLGLEEIAIPHLKYSGLLWKESEWTD